MTETRAPWQRAMWSQDGEWRIFFAHPHIVIQRPKMHYGDVLQLTVPEFLNLSMLMHDYGIKNMRAGLDVMKERKKQTRGVKKDDSNRRR